MFELNIVSHFKVQIPSGTIKTCTVRWPTDQEFCDRVHRLKIVRRSLGRGKGITDTPGEHQVNLEFFNRIRVDEDGPVFDAYEATKVIERFDRCSVINVERVGADYRIELDVPGGPVAHVLKIPTQRDAQEYARAATKFIDDRRQLEILVAFEPAATLYEKVMVSTEGYAGAVPITHKHAVVREMLDQIDALASDAEIEVPE
jgi:hypothetical protein